MNTSALIRKRINHHSMWFSCKFKTGERFKFRVTRYSQELTGTSMGNDIDDDLDVIRKWLDSRNTRPYGDLFKELERLCATCNTGLDLIELMNKTS